MSTDSCVVCICICFGILCLAVAYRLIKSADDTIKDAAEIFAADENNYYFTYGTDRRFPFILGWTRVIAPSYEAAIAAFRAYHSDRSGYGTINCSDIYTEEQFYATSLPIEGNGGAFEHEVIRINRVSKEDSEE